MSEDRLVTSGELAKLLGLSQRSIARYARTGKLAPAVVTPGGQYRWDVDDVRRQMRELRERHLNE